MAILLEKLLTELRALGVPAVLLGRITNLYKDTYREGYADGYEDARAELTERDRDSDWE